VGGVFSLTVKATVRTTPAGLVAAALLAAAVLFPAALLAKRLLEKKTSSAVGKPEGKRFFMTGLCPSE
jgi:hypothetical protein